MECPHFRLCELLHGYMYKETLSAVFACPLGKDSRFCCELEWLKRVFYFICIGLCYVVDLWYSFLGCFMFDL